MSKPLVSVLLLTKNPGPGFKEIVRVVLSQEDISYEVIAADDGSTDGTVRLMEKNGIKVYSVKPNEFGHGRTRNIIANLAQGRLLAFLTHDSLPVGERWLYSLTKPFSDSLVAGVFGRQVPKPRADLLEKYYLDYLYPADGREISMSENKEFKLPEFFFSNANSMIRKSVWQKIKFPEGVLMSEDQWWAKEVLSSGYKIVYAPQAVVKHSHSYSLKNLFRRNFDSGVSLRGLDQSSGLESFQKFVNFVFGEIKFLISNGQINKLPYALSRNLVRTLGFILGQNYFLLPKQLRKNLGMHRYFWTNEER